MVKSCAGGSQSEYGKAAEAPQHAEHHHIGRFIQYCHKCTVLIKHRVSFPGRSAVFVFHFHNDILGIITEVLAEQVHAAYMLTVIVYLQYKGKK